MMPATSDLQRENEQLRQQIEALRLQLGKKTLSAEAASNATVPTTAAQVTVRLPADAKLFIDDVACPLTSETRSFTTANLKQGEKYFYVVRAEVVRNGTPVSETQRVVFQAGQQVSVAFTNLPVVAESRP